MLEAVVRDSSGAEARALVAVTIVRNEPVPPGEFDRILSGDHTGDHVIDDGARVLVGDLRIAGNLIVLRGTLVMRPGSYLKFVGANPDEYVGGGMTYAPEFARDIGLWIGHEGKLDIQGTPKRGWNRTGIDPTWKADDEYWIAPTEIGDYAPRRWFPGDPIPRVLIPALLKAEILAKSGAVPDYIPVDWWENGIPAEVMNVTRDIVIEGPGHIHVHPHVHAQIVRFCQLKNLGVSNLASNGPVLGRYALHIHHGFDASRGTVIEGVAAIDCPGRVFVPHESSGIFMRDNVSVNSWADALWWDEGSNTDDLICERLCVSGMLLPKTVRPKGTGPRGVVNGSGHKPVLRDSAVSGVVGDAYFWSNAHHARPFGSTWTFEDNLAHNCTGTGLFFWLNCCLDGMVQDHHPKRSVIYRCGGPNRRGEGIENGAYRNSHRYTDALLIDNSIIHHSRSESHSLDGGPARYTNVHVAALDGPAIETGQLQAAGNGSRIEWIDCVLKPAAGHPVLLVKSGASHPFLALFRRCGIGPDDVQFSGSLEGSSIIIEQEDGRTFEVFYAGGRQVREL